MKRKMNAKKLAVLLLAIIMSLAFMPTMALAIETGNNEEEHIHDDECGHSEPDAIFPYVEASTTALHFLCGIGRHEWGTVRMDIVTVTNDYNYCNGIVQRKYIYQQCTRNECPAANLDVEDIFGTGRLHDWKMGELYDYCANCTSRRYW